MNRETFISGNTDALNGLIKISQGIGARADYVQGGGGNTSVKLGGGLMAIKASGYRLSQITLDDGYAVMDYNALREFYAQTPGGDAEDEGARKAKDATVAVGGLKPLRPSVEAGFHAALDKYVVHSHSVYANLLACCAQGEELVAKAMEGIGASCCSVAYTNPGVKLTFSIMDSMAKAEAETGKKPRVVFMRNHGLIVTGDDADAALALHAKVNERAAALFGVKESDYPGIALEEKDGLFYSRTPYLNKLFRNCAYTVKDLAVDALYPDQLVYLADSFAIVDAAPAEFTQKCTIVRESGDVVYNCPRDTASTIEETLLAVLYILELLKAKGYTVRTMDDAGKDFIANWESEAYRKSLLK